MTKNWLNDLVDASPAAQHIAWAGELEFKAATETDRAGRTVQFILRRQQKELASAHPFSAHTRRRRGHAGTMFTMSLEPLNGGPPLVGGAMLLNWASTPQGDTATFLINYEAERHPFLSCTRAGKDQEATRWMAVFVEEDDQSTPVDQTKRQKLEDLETQKLMDALAPDPAVEGQSVCTVCRKSPVERCICDGPGSKRSLAGAEVFRKPKQQIKNSNLAAQFIKNPLFWRFIGDWCDATIATAGDADAALKYYCSIVSKAQLDNEQIAKVQFDQLRSDFVKWQQDEGIDVTQ